MTADAIIEVTAHLPPGVIEILATSFDYCIGRLDDQTVLKYLLEKGNPDLEAQKNLAVEAQIYSILGHHPRILGFRGGSAVQGLRLEFASHGSVAQYLKLHKPSMSRKLRWSLQAAEGTAYIHSLNVLHCDISTNNLLLDGELNVKMADFQGRYVAPDGSVLLDGQSSENVKSSMPRFDSNHADRKTDIFALGSAIFYIIEGHEPFPELNPLDDDDEVEIMRRYASGQYPTLNTHLMTTVVHRCWSGAFESAGEVVEATRNAMEIFQVLDCIDGGGQACKLGTLDHKGIMELHQTSV